MKRGQHRRLSLTKKTIQQLTDDRLLQAGGWPRGWLTGWGDTQTTFNKSAYSVCVTSEYTCGDDTAAA